MSHYKSCLNPEWTRTVDGKWVRKKSWQANDWSTEIINNSNELLLAQSEDFIQIPHFASNYNTAIDNETNSTKEDDINNISESKSDKNVSEVSSNSSSKSSSKSSIISATDISQDLYNRIDNLESSNKQLQSELKRLQLRLTTAEDNIEDHHKYIYFLQKNLARLDQYGRRENIEIKGIPSHIKDGALESEVLKILRKLGLYHLESFHIVGCHRIGKSDKNGCRITIVRFLHRKDANYCLINKNNLHLCKSLGYNNLSIVENLCPAYKSIYEDLTQLQYDGQVKKIWTYNGIPNYIKTDRVNDKPVKVYHECDLDKFFNGSGDG